MEKSHLVMPPIQATHKKASQFLYYYSLFYASIDNIKSQIFSLKDCQC